MLHARDQTSRGVSRPRPAATRSRAVSVLLQVVAMAGLAALVYPFAADWVSTLGHNAARSGYVRSVSALDAADRAAQLHAAQDYNAHLPEGALHDPYAREHAGASHEDDARYREYTQLLGSSEDAVIGEVVYPRLHIGLPLFAGTGPEAISAGVGHLYGSSLPVGGPSTHAVLTAHSGLVHASLFTRLPRAQVGDLFEVSVLGETLVYKVAAVETVEPFVTESLQVAPGEDRVTLFTCTPIGVNSHRFLVHGVRVPGGEEPGSHALAGDGQSVPFPWWALAFVAGTAAIAYVLFAPRRVPEGSRPAERLTRRPATDTPEKRDL